MKGPQATVRSWENGVGGTVFLDDGTVLDLPARCLDESVFRFLRAGQRVRIVLVSGVVDRVDLPL